MAVELQGNFSVIYESIESEDKRFSILQEIITSLKEGDEFAIMSGYQSEEIFKTFNSWLREVHPEYVEILKEEVIYDVEDSCREDAWFEYITDGKWGYDDQFTFCEHCGGVIDMLSYYRPDGDMVYDGCGLTCRECIQDNEEIANDYIDTLINNPDKSNEFLDLEKYDFIKWKEEERNKHKIYNDLRDFFEDNEENVEIVFDSTGLFFSVWIRDKNREDEPHYTDKLYGGYFTYNQMVANAKKEYDYGYETNFLTYMKDWWKEKYIRLSGELD